MRRPFHERPSGGQARWLATVHKHRVAVAADDQLTEEEKKGNLPLLGWNNRLFGPPGLARPSTHDQEGTASLGLRERDRASARDRVRQSRGGDPTHAIPNSREIHAIRGYALSPTTREEIRLLAREAYGPCFLTTVYEGLALSAENSLRGENMEMHAAPRGGPRGVRRRLGASR